MKGKSEITKTISTTIFFLGIIWIIFLIDYMLPFVHLKSYGIHPRSISGLTGILCAPFLHGNFAHIIANSTALVFLLPLSLAFSKRLTYTAMSIITIVGGGFVWLLGSSNSNHIGASGIIFGLIGFLIAVGIYRKSFKALIVSLIVLLFYGGTLLTVLSIMPGVSWTGHFFGAVSGVLAAKWSGKDYC